MNEFSDLEAELKQLRPVAPSSELATRVGRALAEVPSTTPSAAILPRKRTPRRNWFALGLSLAAASVFFFLVRPTVDRQPAKAPAIAATGAPSTTAALPARALVPDGVTRVVYHTRDEGLLFPGNGEEPVRRVRAHSRETLQWKDHHSGASLRVSYPTEEVEFIPISGQ